MSVMQLFKMTLGLFIINSIERRDGFTHFIFLDHQKIRRNKKVECQIPFNVFCSSPRYDLTTFLVKWTLKGPFAGKCSRFPGKPSLCRSVKTYPGHFFVTGSQIKNRPTRSKQNLLKSPKMRSFFATETSKRSKKSRFDFVTPVFDYFFNSKIEIF